MFDRYFHVSKSTSKIEIPKVTNIKQKNAKLVVILEEGASCSGLFPRLPSNYVNLKYERKRIPSSTKFDLLGFFVIESLFI